MSVEVYIQNEIELKLEHDKLDFIEDIRGYDLLYVSKFYKMLINIGHEKSFTFLHMHVNIYNCREDMRDYGDQYVPKFYNGWIPSPNPPMDNRMAMEEAVANQRRQVEGRYMEDRARQEVGEGDFILQFAQQSDWSIGQAKILNVKWYV